MSTGVIQFALRAILPLMAMTQIFTNTSLAAESGGPIRLEFSPTRELERQEVERTVQIMSRRLLILGIRDGKAVALASNFVVEIPSNQSDKSLSSCLARQGILSVHPQRDTTPSVVFGNPKVSTMYVTKESILKQYEENEQRVLNEYALLPSDQRDFAMRQRRNEIENVRRAFSPRWTIDIALSEADRLEFQKLTRDNIDRIVDVRLDNETIFSPRIVESIPDGRISISVAADSKGNCASSVLESGSLPASLIHSNSK